MGSLDFETRKLLSLKMRQDCALQQSRRPLLEHINNGDEKLFPSWSANHTKGLPHLQSGEVLPGSYESLLDALRTEDPAAFQKLARGSGMRLVSPQAAFSLHLEGADAQTFFLPPPPSVASAEGAAIKAAVSTSSPGMFLAFAGALLIGLSLYVPTTVESSDVAVYLPRQVEVVDPGPLAGNSASREAPAALGPAAPDAAPAGKETDSMPQSLKQRLGIPPASTSSR